MKLLVHMCCGPCAVYPLESIKEKGIEAEGLFYNPNIHPREEYERRKENVLLLAEKQNLKVHVIEDFRQEQWERFSGSEVSRCQMCYALRMRETAEFAKDNGYDSFTTTLLVSPYQKHELIVELCEKYAKEFGIEFYYEDFRVGFRKGQQGAKDLGLYRQKFCGCIVSYNESPFTKK